MKKLHDLLNVAVADFNVLFVKLHHYHWYVKGLNFFQLHEKFEAYYDEMNELFDEFAERLLTIGGTPASSLDAYLKLTTLKEETQVKSANEMLLSIKNDFETIIKNLKESLEVAGDANDEVTVDLLVTTIASLEKHVWMLNFTLA